MSKARRQFTPEFKSEVVGLVEGGDRSLAQVCRDLDLTPSAVRNWVRQARIDQGQGPVGALSSAEREELNRLRRDNQRLRQERDILKSATVFFARESR